MGKYIQTSLLSQLFPEQEKPLFDPYWNGWAPKVGALARINKCISFCKTVNSNAYCAQMRVKVVAISGKIATVSTTKEWEQACGVTSGTN